MYSFNSKGKGPYNYISLTRPSSGADKLRIKETERPVNMLKMLMQSFIIKHLQYYITKMDLSELLVLLIVGILLHKIVKTLPQVPQCVTPEIIIYVICLIPDVNHYLFI